MKCCLCNDSCKCLDFPVFLDENKNNRTSNLTGLSLIWLLWDVNYTHTTVGKEWGTQTPVVWLYPSLGWVGQIVMCSSKKYPRRALLLQIPTCHPPPPPGIFIIFQLGQVPSGKDICVKLLHYTFIAKDNFFFDKMRKNLFIYVQVRCLMNSRTFLANN